MVLLCVRPTDLNLRRGASTLGLSTGSFRCQSGTRSALGQASATGPWASKTCPTEPRAVIRGLAAVLKDFASCAMADQGTAEELERERFRCRQEFEESACCEPPLSSRTIRMIRTLPEAALTCSIDANLMLYAQSCTLMLQLPAPLDWRYASNSWDCKWVS